MDPVEAVKFVTGTLVQWYNNFFRNLYHMWDGMTLIKYIRMIAIVGAYLLLRPYLEKLGAKIQAKEHEKEIDAYDEAAAKGETKNVKVSPNMLRGAGGKVVELEDSESEDETTGSDVKWGKKARKRQRATVKKLLEDQERLRKEQDGDEDDADIMEHLVDYEPGKDGW